jgi:hypothetical protein
VGSVAPKSIAEAINEVTEDEVLDDDTDDVVEDEGEEKQASLLDEDEEEPAEEADEEAEAEEEDKPRGDVVGEEPEEGAEAAPADAEDAFDTLTAEEIAAIKADPALNKLRKSLMRGYSAKTQEHSHLVQLGLAYRRDPQGVLKAIADSLGMTVSPAQAAAAAAAAAAPPVVDPGKELEDLFGPQIGPKVRAVFDKWAEARIGATVAPVQQTLGKVVSQSEAARMQAEENSFKSRHKDVTPQIEAEIVALGQSGKIVPGDMSPAEYLDTLYDVVMARRARQSAKTAGKTASVKLAKRIEANRRDREPSGVSGRGGSVKKVSNIANARSISEALDMAMKELEDER